VERQTGCDSTDLMSIIVPGWRESCETEWVIDMISNLTIYRGGCIICMDYYAFSQNGDYFALVRQFYSISDVLVGTLRALETDGFDPDKFFMFGFSFGGHLALNAAIEFGVKKVGEIDSKLCNSPAAGLENLDLFYF
jgi:acetyl esterase/lipase